MQIKRKTDDYLAHHGVKGQRWGVRRYQNADGSLTEAGRKKLDRFKSTETKKLDDRIENVENKRDKVLNKYDKKIAKIHTKASKRLKKLTSSTDKETLNETIDSDKKMQKYVNKMFRTTLTKDLVKKDYETHVNNLIKEKKIVMNYKLSDVKSESYMKRAAAIMKYGGTSGNVLLTTRNGNVLEKINSDSYARSMIRLKNNKND